MKNLSGYQLEIPMHKAMQASSFQMNINTSFLTNTSTYVLNKLTGISPFLLLLVPVFMMMVFTLFSRPGNVNENTASIQTTHHTEILKSNSHLVK